MLVFRAIYENELKFENNSLEELGTMNSNEYYFDCFHKHLTKGSFYGNGFLKSFSKSYSIAYYFSEPVVYRGNRIGIKCLRKVKIRKSKIIACEFDESKMWDITNRESFEIQNYCKGTAYTYGKSNEEVLLIGKIDNYIEFTLLQSDLMYILCEEKLYNQQYDINKISFVFKHIEENLELTLIESIIYQLMYIHNKNLYEIIAPLYYSNDVDIKNLYGLILNTIKSILNKAISCIDDSIDIRYETVIRMYESELNFVCLKYNEYTYLNEQVDFNILFEVYKKELIRISNKKELYYKIDKNYSISEKLNYITQKEYPLFLYLPKNEKILRMNYFEFDEKKDLFFELIKYKVIKSRKKENYTIEVIVAQNYKGYRNYEYMPYSTLDGNKKFRSSICKFVSEVYIPDSYLEVEDNVFTIDLSSCFNSKIVVNKYCDLLVRVFGGENLKDKNICFRNREFIKEIK